MPITAFVSYSHNDDKRRERLHKHLAMLQRDNLLKAWTDHEVLAGDKLDDAVRRNLEDSGLFIALVSPDYLASSYCYEKEFLHALSLQDKGRLRIVAIVVEPCDWQNSPFHQFLVLPKDGKPVSEWTNDNSAYLNVVTELRRVLEHPAAAGAAQAIASPTGASIAPRRVKVKQDFDAIQRAEFADEAYETFRSYFERSCAELGQVSDQIKARYELMGPTAFTCTVVNRGKLQGGEAHITVHNTKGSRHSFGAISYLNQRYAAPGSSNGSYSVEADDYRMYLVAGMSLTGNREAKLTAEQAATRLWDDIVKQAGIDYE